MGGEETIAFLSVYLASVVELINKMPNKMSFNHSVLPDTFAKT